MTNSTMGSMFEEVEAELLKQFRATTPEQLAEEHRLRQIQREYEAKHTAIETDETRADKDEYPDDED
jgi:hypothetical protein